MSILSNAIAPTRHRFQVATTKPLRPFRALLSGLIALASALCPMNPKAQSPDARAPETAVSPLDQELREIMQADQDAQDEVDQWILEDRDKRQRGEGDVGSLTLNARIRQRFESVKEKYENFLLRNPDHVEARLAYGSFLDDLGREQESVEQYEKALALDPGNPVTYNNLANYYGHRGPVTRAFEYYQKAIELNPKESLYYHNFGTTVYLFRKDAREHFDITEQEVFDKAMKLYEQALKLDPKNFPLAVDIAQSYYGIKPTRYEDQLEAFEYALNVARDDIERQGIYIHLARTKINAGLLHEARKHLEDVQHEMYKALKGRLLRKLERIDEEGGGEAAVL